MITLVLGGTRSGKSEVAERLAAESGDPVTYVATARVDPADSDHVARIEAHRDRRPPGWTTIECPNQSDLISALADIDGPILVDSLGTWLTLDPGIGAELEPMLRALERRVAPVVLVSEEVGLAIHPPTALGRRYVDALGELNQMVSARADRALLVVAGRPLELPPHPLAPHPLAPHTRGASTR